MVFRVIVTHESEEYDENTYYGTVFPNEISVKSNKLKYSLRNNRLETTFAFSKQDEHCLTILVPVEEKETRPIQLRNIKIRTNTARHGPEVIQFP